MSVTVEAATLATALKTVGRALPRVGSMPVLSGVRLTADGTVLTATCSNLELTITASIPCRKGKLDVIAPARLVTDFVGHLDGAVTIDATSGAIDLTSEKSQANFRTMEVKGWPAFPELEGEPFKFTPETITLLGRIVHAAAIAADKKPEHEAVRFQAGAVFCTDTYRFAKFDLDGAPDAVIPSAAIAALVSDAAEGCTFVTDGRSARFETAATSWTVRCIATQPIDWPRVLRGSSPHDLRVERKALLDALQIVALGDVAEVTFGLADEVLTAQITGVDRGEIRSALDAAGNIDFPIKFNRGYLLDLVGAVESDELLLEILHAQKSVEVHDGPVTLMLMPVRI